MRKRFPFGPQDFAPEGSYAVVQLVNDVYVADRLGMAVQTVRGQRFKRRHGLDHWFTVDPVYIGSRPRYRLADVQKWLQTRPCGA